MTMTDYVLIAETGYLGVEFKTVEPEKTMEPEKTPEPQQEKDHRELQ
jgi:hypothetical protein